MPTPLQSKGGAADATSLSVTYTSNLSANTKLIAAVTLFGSTASTVKDAALNSFTKLVSRGLNNNTATGELSLWAIDVPAGDVGSAPSITITGGAGTTAIAMVIQEVPGLIAGNTSAMLDGSAGLNSGTIAANGNAACGSYSTSAAGEYMVALYGDDEFSNNTAAAPTGSTTYTRDSQSQQANGIENCTVAYGSSTGSAETATFAITGVTATSDWATILAAFQLAPAATATPVLQAKPGKTWLRRYKHRQALSTPAAVTSPDLTINAPAVTATGTSPQPIFSGQYIAGIPSATGTAPQPVAANSVIPGIPVATGGVTPPGMGLAAPAASVTGTAPQPVVSESLPAPATVATGTAPQAVANPQSVAGVASATGTASQPVISEQVPPGIPVATGIAPAPTLVTGLAINAPAVVATGTSPGPVPQISPLPAAPTATAAVTQPVTSHSALPAAPVATAAAAAVANVQPVAPPAVATGSAQAVVSISVLSGIPVATGAVTAPSITTGLVINAPATVATGIVPQPVAAESVFAVVAVASGVAPVASRGVGAPPATSTGAAPQPGMAIAANPLVATAFGLVSTPQVVSVLPHVTARSTSSVSAKVNSVSSADDPREASASVTGNGSTSQTSNSKRSTSSVTQTDGSVSSVS